MTKTTWQHPLPSKDLKSDRLDLWRANLNLSTVVIDKLANSLSQDEIARANKFRFLKDKNKFIAARGILREILSSYLDIKPQYVEFQYSDRGKPCLGGVTATRGWQFNLSHSQDYALYGLIQNRLIGVDLEYLRAMEEAEKIAQRFFTPREYNLISSLPDEQKPHVFFQLWTAKEAYLKAIGTGLAGSLASVEIALNSSAEIYLNTIQGNSQTVAQWSILSCIPANNYIAAIAIKDSFDLEQINYWNWHEDSIK